MPRTEEQFQEIRDTRKNLIIDSAFHLFAEKGFASTSMSTLAKQAGVSKGLIYNYFDNKEDLIIQMINKGLEEFLPDSFNHSEAPLSDEEFIALLNYNFDLLKSNLAFWKLYFLILAQPEVLMLVEKKLTEMLMPILSVFVNYFQSQGFENPMAHARFLGAILDGVSLNYMMDPENFPLEEIKKIMINKIIQK